MTDKRMHEQEMKFGKIEIKTWLKGKKGGDEWRCDGGRRSNGFKIPHGESGLAE